MKFFIPLFIFAVSCFAQNNAKQEMLDSLNRARVSDKGAFNLYIKKPEFEIIAGAYRNRENALQGFDPITFTYHIYLPFQYDLNYVNLKAKDKLLKINTTFIFHHSKFGNYAAGLGARFSFLIAEKTYLSYQGGIVWCEVVKPNTNDGFANMGFCLQHEFSLSYHVSKHIKLSANALHISSAKLFKDVDNIQDVLGIGCAYLF